MVWYLKQLLPLTYRSHYEKVGLDEESECHFVVWKMWFGRCFAVDDVVLG